MTCGHADGGSGRPCGGSDGDDGRSALGRRDFLKVAVATGGANGLAACMELEGDVDPASPDDAGDDGGPRSLRDGLPDAQHRWAPYFVTDPHGNTVMPAHNALLFLDYHGDGAPTAADRQRLEDGLRAIEHAFEWGTGDALNPVINRGMLFLVGYSHGYFQDRFGRSPVRAPRDVLDELDEDAEPLDADAFLFLSSGLAKNVVMTEEVLFGDRSDLNGERFDDDLTEIFEVVDRRTGFVGQTLPRKRDPGDHDIPEQSPLLMGFKSGYTDNIPDDARVTLEEGPFAGGTTAQVSHLTMDLDGWYELDHERRVHQMFSPAHDPEEVGEVGHDLASTSGVDRDVVDATDRHARERGVVGHGQKAAAARDDEEFLPKVVRRDFDTVDGDDGGLAFVGLQRSIDDFVELRKAMNGDDIDVPQERHGILDFLDVDFRDTMIVPPRDDRALPTL